MAAELNPTHDPARRSWVDVANVPDNDFPLQNLPFGVFLEEGEARGGVALGEFVIDLRALVATAALVGPARAAAQAASGSSLAPLLACAPNAVSALRAQLSQLFSAASADRRGTLQNTLVPMAQAQLLLPLRPPAFTDFCTSIEHIGRMGGAGALPRAAQWLPVAYNGRASSVVVSGTPVVRPVGLFEAPPRSGQVQLGPEPMLDFELELGAWLRDGNTLGETLSVERADAMVFGCCLLNDWSARGIQFFESLLGPHLGKSFATTISPWIVTSEALAPFRVSARGRHEHEPAVPTHLLDSRDQDRGAYNLELTAELSASSGETGTIVRSNARGLYWTLAQMVTHQASNGAPLELGDLIATGTISGLEEHSRACLAEATRLGTAPLVLAGSLQRAWLEDGDTVTLRGRATAPGFVSVGFGECRGTIQPARGYP